MTYAMMFYETPEAMAERNSEKAPAYWAAWTSYIDSMGKAGVMKGGQGLETPQMATTVRLKGSQRLVQDGPYADTKEQLGGFVTIEVENLDAALEWASRSPAASHGSVEVRPVLPPPPAR